ncbi:histidinol dehydrogenase [Salaquimonas pukyongi]|uniref:histidinol dehydrogenase n=1 Tax=Salaquimonas pukyongi TaxID=2712698 RepID=UPI00096B7497|nr:histidinol dehydrogenase [Salaquimonas pukyongi]
MPERLDSTQKDFDAQFASILSAKREQSADVDAVVASIIADVRKRGDAALLDYTARFDRLTIEAEQLQVSADEIAAATDCVPKEQLDALTLARDRIHSHHEKQMPQDDRYSDAAGVELGSRWTAVEAVGLYVPGGTASYPSSVLMNAVPAKVAGVERLVMVVPSPGGELNPLVLAAADLAGVDEVYRIGGAQAVAALAHGTQTIAPVAKIVGPGNAYVAAAKRQVFGTVGIDMIAGPSEVLIVADGENNPDWLALDLLAQAEHDTAAQSILITDSPELAASVAEAVERHLQTLPRAEIAAASWRDYGVIITVEKLADALPLVNRLAPEHLEIATADPEALLDGVRNAGAVFLGKHTPEAIGDYVGGSNHVLPTARSARFSSGLSVLDFVKRTSILKCGPDQLAAIGPAAVTLAEAEGLQAHGRSVSIRMNR